MSKYDAEFAGLSDYALLGRVRQRLMAYRFSNRRHGRRANWMAGAIEEWAFQQQAAMETKREEPPMHSQAAQINTSRVLGASKEKDPLARKTHSRAQMVLFGEMGAP